MSVRSYLDKHPSVNHSIFIDETALVLGEVNIGDDSSIWPMVAIRGDINKITIGMRTNIQDGCVLHVTHDSEYCPGGFPLKIGNDVTVGHKAVLHACTIEDRCLIGMSATVLDGAVIKTEAIVGAGSIVPPNKICEGGYLWLGTPVKRIRALTDQEIDYLKYSADYYVQLKNNHLNNAQ